MNFGAPEIMIVLLVAVVIFGPSKLPKLARSMGEAAHAFRSGHDADPDPAPLQQVALDAAPTPAAIEPPVADVDAPAATRSLYSRDA
jgi:sec-independent protein translocase protein TatA